LLLVIYYNIPRFKLAVDTWQGCQYWWKQDVWIQKWRALQIFASCNICRECKLWRKRHLRGGHSQSRRRSEVIDNKYTMKLLEQASDWSAWREKALILSILSMDWVCVHYWRSGRNHRKSIDDCNATMIGGEFDNNVKIRLEKE
jgi:hypothetical protein